jgi:beta-glucanase (GH16 family)
LAGRETLLKNLRVGTLSLLGLVAFAACAGRHNGVSSPTEPSTGWTLAWSDEFERAGPPDPARWDYEEGRLRNQELQYYTRARPENARVENGRLVIEARREPFQGASYTAASLVTRGRESIRYGKVEIRALLPRGRGLWPALWMLGDDIATVGWPRCGEIDIMEHVGFEPGRVHGTVHTDAYNHVKGTQRGASLDVGDLYDTFRVYSIEWRPERIDFFVDGRQYFSFAREGSSPAVWPFDRPHYLIMNVAVGGSWGGQQGIDESVFPQRMAIDYVRVYRMR